MTIQCITFDLDDTLWECHPVIMHAEKCFYAWLKSSYPKIIAKYSEEALINHRVAFMQDNQEQKHNLTYLRKRWLEILGNETGYDNDSILIETGFEIFWLARNEVSFFEGTLDVLEQLSKKYTLGVISNGNADVHHIGIGHLFDFTLSSEKAGISKPHKDIFHKAIDLSPHDLHETVYVGDDPARDIIGAHNAGMKAIWYNPKLKPWPGGRTPDAVIRSIHELEDKIVNL
ncbi:MAG TPA: HAD family hydrolase [Leucothrix mucor]|nr:HAD family hydrolase [Leucothrix mucor]